MNSSTRMYVGRVVLSGRQTPEEAAKEHGVSVQSVRGWVRQARKLAEAESLGGLKAPKKKETADAGKKSKTLPKPEQTESVKEENTERGSTWENLI